MARSDYYTEVTEINNARDLFSDFLIDFSVHPEKNDLLRQINEQSVKRAIKNLVLTNTYERPFQPLIGADINALLFELITPETAYVLKQKITRVINDYEPRCRLLEVRVDPYIEENGYVVTITFQAINTEAPLQLQVLLNRVR